MDRDPGNRGPMVEGQGFAVENLAIEPHTRARLQHYVKRLLQEPTEIDRCAQALVQRAGQLKSLLPLGGMGWV